jgi:hypothetical protein
LESPRLNFWIPADDADVGVPEVSFRVDMMVLIGYVSVLCELGLVMSIIIIIINLIHGEIFFFFGELPICPNPDNLFFLSQGGTCEIRGFESPDI